MNIIFSSPCQGCQLLRPEVSKAPQRPRCNAAHELLVQDLHFRKKKYDYRVIIGALNNEMQQRPPTQRPNLIYIYVQLRKEP